MGLRVVVVINKVDRAYSRPVDVLNETFDLFIELGANDEQANFPVVYAIGLAGRAGYTSEDIAPDLTPLFETILKEIPAPEVDPEAPARMLVTTLEYDSYKGQIAIGRLHSGIMRRGMPIVRITPHGERTTGRIEYLFSYHNLSRKETDQVEAGDILAFAGLDVVGISDTITDPADETPLPPINVEEPTVRMTFGVNTSPFSGREGKSGWGTSRRLRQRLYEEIRHNVALRVADGATPDRFVVSGRGELHLSILIETMRREGYEFDVSKPEVIYRTEAETGETLEPYEEVYVDVAENLTGTVIELLGARRGRMLTMTTESGTTYLTYLVPTRGLLGFRSQFIRSTGGMGQVHSIFHSYDVLAGPVPRRQLGSLVAWETGVTTNFGLDNAEMRGALFIGAGFEVYEGMVVGEHIRPEDLAVNVAKTKHLTNVRSVSGEKASSLTPPRHMSLEDCLEFLADDELLEVTPQNLRIRKRILDNEDRMKEAKRREKLMAGA
jgi:GTP-binding protein